MNSGFVEGDPICAKTKQVCISNYTTAGFSPHRFLQILGFVQQWSLAAYQNVSIDFASLEQTQYRK